MALLLKVAASIRSTNIRQQYWQRQSRQPGTPFAVDAASSPQQAATRPFRFLRQRLVLASMFRVSMTVIGLDDEAR
jgi:hypothetical protein